MSPMSPIQFSLIRFDLTHSLTDSLTQFIHSITHWLCGHLTVNEGVAVAGAAVLCRLWQHTHLASSMSSLWSIAHHVQWLAFLVSLMYLRRNMFRLSYGSSQPGTSCKTIAGTMPHCPLHVRTRTKVAMDVTLGTNKYNSRTRTMSLHEAPLFLAMQGKWCASKTRLAISLGLEPKWIRADGHWPWFCGLSCTKNTFVDFI